MHHIIGDAPGMLFGPTGSGKSMLVRSVIQSATKEGVKVAVCDTEANYMQEDTEWLQAHTKYTHVGTLQGILDWLRSLSGVKLIVVDSIGGPAYGQYVEADRKRAGDTFKKIAHVSHVMQQACLKNGAMGIAVNQPTSEFAGPGGGNSRTGPFGGKSGFYSREVIETVERPPKDGWSISLMQMWKSRHMKLGLTIGSIGISDDKVAVKFRPYQGRRPTGYPETQCIVPNPALGVEEEAPEPEQEEEQPEEEQQTEEPEDATEIPVEEETGDGFLEGGEELQAVLDDIAKIMEEKKYSDIQFKAIMKSKNMEVEYSEQIGDLDTANAVKDILETFGEQRGDQ